MGTRTGRRGDGGVEHLRGLLQADPSRASKGSGQVELRDAPCSHLTSSPSLGLQCGSFPRTLCQRRHLPEPIPGAKGPASECTSGVGETGKGNKEGWENRGERKEAKQMKRNK